MIDGGEDSNALFGDAYTEPPTPGVPRPPEQRASDEAEPWNRLADLSDRARSGHDHRDKGGFGERWIETLAEIAGLGCAFERVERSIGELTFTLAHQIGRLQEAKIAAQVKTTAEPGYDKFGRIAYPLDATSYNRLVGPFQHPHYLFLVITSKERRNRMSTCDSGDKLSGGVYYHSLRGESPTKNRSKKTVYIDAKNRISPESLIQLCVNAAHEFNADLGVTL
ncbi:DUF4365 domain-containing protein [Frankia sp. CNm7]|uniref:DUF4365 domain-containing protein n=1 Tax=Frankia nepalensis TaxID=1836974 RepID=A0A937RFB7_9ACTN|nr:DUF4365 domain-containing protein [Frankia nepalensis]MBL7498151.1 DUF4365 domain-containing protein [Frankia nepalensis]MBL7509331.1 DUF4365 domain-containing protein [Frankia nepalensis]MBL7516881.1 DUF4365 domain-containing protein [Frankia nepalensis]MBL7627940.1 DUF4365 domain-containing protein [Frankia nepalensis]